MFCKDKNIMWVCSKCGEEFIDPIANVPSDKICVVCTESYTEDNNMKKITSSGVKPSSSIQDVISREEYKNLSKKELKEVLLLLGFSEEDIEKAFKNISNIN